MDSPFLFELYPQFRSLVTTTSREYARSADSLQAFTPKHGGGIDVGNRQALWH